MAFRGVMGSKVLLTQKINTLLANGDFHELIRTCIDYEKKHPKRKSFWIKKYLIVSYFKTYAIQLAFREAEATKRAFPEHAQECDELVLTELFILKAQANSPPISGLISAARFTDKMRKAEYVQALDTLKQEHCCLQPTLLDALRHINKLLHFYLETFTTLQNYICPTYLAQSKTTSPDKDDLKNGILLRSIVSTPIEELSNPNLWKLLDTNLERAVNEQIDTLSHEIFFCDAQLLLKMVFKTMYLMDREQSKALLHFLPWGSNAWHFLFFLGSLMRNEETAEGDSTLSLPSIDPETKRFFLTLRGNNLILKAALFDPGFREDLARLQVLFQDAHDFLLRPENADRNLAELVTPKIQKLPVMKSLLWYFKHTYNLYRLLHLLPKESFSDVQQIKTFKENDILLLRDTISRISATDKLGFKPIDLKTRLAFLRRLQWIGEFFTRKNWGFFLNTMDYFDPYVMASIRNGLVHIEELHEPNNLFAFEQDADKLCRLQKELQHLSAHILRTFLSARDDALPAFPSEEKWWSRAKWLPEARTYWQGVKDYYEQQFRQFTFEEDASVLFEQNFIPQTVLLTKDNLTLSDRQKKAVLKALVLDETTVMNADICFQYVRLALAPHPTELQKLESALKGTIPFVKKELTDMVRDALGQKSPFRAILWEFIAIAELQATVIRTEKRSAFQERQKKFDHELAEREARRKDVVDNCMTRHYPELLQCAQAFDTQLLSPKKLGLSALFAVLTNRLDTLVELHGLVPGTISSASIQNAMEKDINIFLASSYLLGQVVVLMNRLHCLGHLDKIDPELDTVLEEYVKLRNALEHCDPFIYSEKDHQLLMNSRLPHIMSWMIVEIIIRFRQKIIEYSKHLSDENPEALEKSKVKQSKPLDAEVSIILHQVRMRFYQASLEGKVDSKPTLSSESSTSLNSN